MTLITFDRDFLDILRYPLGTTPGRIVIRFKRVTIEHTISRTIQYLRELERREVDMSGKLVVFTNKNIRIRQKP